MFPTKQHHIVSTCFVISIRRRSTPRGFPLCLPLPTRWTPLHPMASKLSFPTSAPLPRALPTAGQPPWKSKTAKQLFCCFPTAPPLRWSISGKNRRTTAALPWKKWAFPGISLVACGRFFLPSNCFLCPETRTWAIWPTFSSWIINGNVYIQRISSVHHNNNLKFFVLINWVTSDYAVLRSWPMTTYCKCMMYFF